MMSDTEICSKHCLTMLMWPMSTVATHRLSSSTINTTLRSFLVISETSVRTIVLLVRVHVSIAFMSSVSSASPTVLLRNACRMSAAHVEASDKTFDVLILHANCVYQMVDTVVAWMTDA